MVIEQFIFQYNIITKKNNNMIPSAVMSVFFAAVWTLGNGAATDCPTSTGPSISVWWLVALLMPESKPEDNSCSTAIVCTGSGDVCCTSSGISGDVFWNVQENSIIKLPI